MKKRLVLIATTIALIAAMVPAALAFAQTQQTDVQTTVQIKDGLAIVAPRSTPVGEQVSITVFRCSDQTPVQGAGVWALSKDKAEAVKAQIAGRKQNADATQLEIIVENSLNVSGTFLGRTNGAGKVVASFDNASGYLLVTFKKGYLPAYKPILIGDGTGKAPAIQAPRKAAPHENVTVTVTEKATGGAVKEAKVWALDKDQAQALKSEIAGLKGRNDPEAIEATINAHASFLGETNGASKLNHKFEAVGGYLLVTYKAGYRPGMTPIVISPEAPKPGNSQNTLETPAPRANSAR